MNNRGQAALEYLMTYGWALIVIAIVVGVLVFIVSSPAGSVVCSSSDPNKIMLKGSQMTSSVVKNTKIGTIIMTNVTGGDMKNADIVVTNVTGAGAFAEGTSTSGTTWESGTVDVNATLTSGEEKKITAWAINPATGAPVNSSSKILLTYTDYAGFNRSATLTCSGPITVTQS